MSELYRLYQATGNEVFSRKIWEFAPYFATVEPYFTELRPGYAEVHVKNRKEVQNHLGSVHAIAMCNGAEAAGGILADVSIPENLRWIPTGIKANYIALAKTDIRVIADGSEIEWNVPGEKDVPIRILDMDDQLVCTATIIVWISEKKS